MGKHSLHKSKVPHSILHIQDDLKRSTCNRPVLAKYYDLALTLKPLLDVGVAG